MSDEGVLLGEVATQLAKAIGLVQSIEVMAETLAGSWGALGHLTCAELDTLARVVMLAGYDELAAQLVVCHASADDDENDQHHDVHAAADDQGELAMAHAQRLLS